MGDGAYICRVGYGCVGRRNVVLVIIDDRLHKLARIAEVKPGYQVLVDEEY
jgi:hypothetical protein